MRRIPRELPARALGYDRHLKSNTSKKRMHSDVSSGGHALRTYPNDAGATLATSGRTLRAMPLEITAFWLAFMWPYEDEEDHEGPRRTTGAAGD